MSATRNSRGESPFPVVAPPPCVCIGVPTFRRPIGLRLLLRSLEQLRTRAAITIIVADNDPETGAGREVAREIANSDCRYPLIAIDAPVRGIVGARNALVEAALKLEGLDYLAMIDDDAWPEPDWLELLLELIEETGVDVVRGAMRPDFEKPPEPWLARTGLYQSNYVKTGRVAQIHAAGNFLARATIFRAVERPWFSNDYALTGGEDDDFFLRLKELGYSFAQSTESIVYERMPPSRCNARWLRERAFMSGASWANIRLRRRPRGWSPALEAAKIVSGLVLGCVGVCVFFWSRSRAFQGVYRICRALGKIRGLRGVLRSHYETIHGG